MVWPTNRLLIQRHVTVRVLDIDIGFTDEINKQLQPVDLSGHRRRLECLDGAGLLDGRLARVRGSSCGIFPFCFSPFLCQLLLLRFDFLAALLLFLGQRRLDHERRHRIFRHLAPAGDVGVLIDFGECGRRRSGARDSTCSRPSRLCARGIRMLTPLTEVNTGSLPPGFSCGSILSCTMRLPGVWRCARRLDTLDRLRLRGRHRSR